MKYNRLVILIIIILSMLFTCSCSNLNNENEENKNGEASNSDSGQTLMVYSGAGLRKPMDEIAEKFKEKYGVQVQFNYAGSSQIMSQLELTNEGDVFIPGSEQYYDLANEKGLVEQKTDIAYHIPAIAVPKGNEKNIKGIKDLKKDGVKVILGDAKSTAIGKTSKKMLEKQNIFDDVMKNVVTTTSTVNEIMVHMSMNEADAAIVWEDNLYNLENVELVSIPEEENMIKTIPVTILKKSNKQELAKKFVDFMDSEEGKGCFKNHGFKIIE